MLMIVLAMAAVQEVSPDPPGLSESIVIERPQWKRTPNRDHLMRVIPEKAFREGASGRATIQCEVIANGHLDQCSVVEEAPLNYGFGQAALQLARRFQMKPTLPDGRPVAGGKVRIPLTFRAP